MDCTSAGLCRSAVAIVALIATIGATPADSTFRPLSMKQVQNPAGIDADWQQHLCAASGIHCEGEKGGLVLYRIAGRAPSELHAISPGPILTRLRYQGRGQWQVLRQWDLSRDSLLDDVEGGRESEPAKLELHPALYPAGAGRWVVALLRTARRATPVDGPLFRAPTSGCSETAAERCRQKDCQVRFVGYFAYPLGLLAAQRIRSHSI